LIEKRGDRKEGVTLADLMERDEKGRYRRSILKTLDPMKYHIDIARYFLTGRKN